MGAYVDISSYLWPEAATGRQPPNAAPNFGCPLFSNGTPVFLLSGTSRRELISGLDMSVTGTMPKVLDFAGFGHGDPNSTPAGNLITTTTQNNSSNACTWFWFGRYGGTNTTFDYILTDYTDGGGGGDAIAFQHSANGGRLTFYDGAVRDFGVTLTAGKVYCIVVAKGSATLGTSTRLYLDGLLLATTGATGLNSSRPICLGTLLDGSNYSGKGTTYLAGKINGYAWSTEEVASFASNPWQLVSAGDIALTMDAGAGAVTLTPALFTDADSFFAPTVTPGAVTLSPSLFTNSDTIFSPSVASVNSLLVTLLDDADVFYAATVTPGAVSLTPPLLSDPSTFYAPTVSPGAVTLTPSIFTDSDTFYSAAVVPGDVILSPALFTDDDIFYSPVVDSGSLTLVPNLFTDGDTFYSATVTPGQVTLAPVLFTDSNTFFSATVSSQITLTPSLLSDDDVFYAATISTSSEQSLFPVLLQNTNSFYSPTLLSGVTLTAADIAAIAEAVWAHPKALTIGKFLALK